MQKTDSTFKDIISGNYWPEYQVNIAGTYYGMSKIVSMDITQTLFSENQPSVGGCVASQINLVLYLDKTKVPKMAEIKPYIRVTNGVKTSSWLQKGDFFVDTRSYNEKTGELTLHGYDRMLMLEQAYLTKEQTNWNVKDVDLVVAVCKKIGVSLETESKSALNKGYYTVNPGYGDGAETCREIMQNIAAAYAGNWIITDDGKMRLIQLNTLPTPTHYLITSAAENITFGGVRIYV